MTEKSTDVSTKIEYTLDFDKIKFNSSYRINKGATAQLVRSLQDMSNRLGDPENSIQKKLYPEIKEICESLVEKYKSLCESVNEEYVREYCYFLMGPYGDGTLRHSTNFKSEKKSYQYSELGSCFRSISNRLFHISREVEQRLSNEKYEDRKNSYESLKSDISLFDKYVKELSEKWKNAVYKIREEEDVKVKERPMKIRVKGKGDKVLKDGGDVKYSN